MEGACKYDLSSVLIFIYIDGHYDDEPSGCTATAALITEKNFLYVVYRVLFANSAKI